VHYNAANDLLACAVVLYRRRQIVLLLICCAATAADAVVEYVEPDYLLQAFQSPPQSEPGYSNSGMWGLKAAGAGANAEAAWNAGFNSCDDVVVGVIGKHMQHHWVCAAQQHPPDPALLQWVALIGNLRKEHG
jgi:hypothetical protein